METVGDLVVCINSMPVGGVLELGGIEYARVEGGVEIDSDFVSLEYLEEYLDTRFHYDAQDCADL